MMGYLFVFLVKFFELHAISLVLLFFCSFQMPFNLIFVVVICFAYNLIDLPFALSHSMIDFILSTVLVLILPIIQRLSALKVFLVLNAVCGSTCVIPASAFIFYLRSILIIEFKLLVVVLFLLLQPICK